MSNPSPPNMQFDVVSVRLNAHASESHCKQATITLDTDLAGNPHAFNPAELLLAALSACMIKGIERVVPILKFDLCAYMACVRTCRRAWKPSPTKSSSTPTSRIADSIFCTKT
jgi:organic hydroperoxide reductase OsmC/OhrA